MPSSLKNVKVAFVDFNLSKYKLQLGVQVLLDDPSELEKIRQKEMNITKERCEKLIKSGANVIMSTKGIDDFAQKYFVESGVIAMRRVKKDDLRRMARAAGGTVLVSMSDLEGEDKLDPALLGDAEWVHEERVGDWDYLFLEGLKQTKAQTILLRGANEFMVNELDRSIHDALCVVKRVLESSSLVAGGGAVETALSIYLDDFARTLGRREQLAIAQFSEALLVIPKTLAINAAKDATELIAKLRVFHNASQSSEDPKKKEFRFSGLDLINGKIRNNLSAGVLEPAISKIKSFK
jgi:T-complex protein 1 subunit alpha